MEFLDGIASIVATYILPGLLVVAMIALHRYGSVSRARAALEALATDIDGLEYDEASDGLAGTLDGVLVAVRLDEMRVAANRMERRLTRITLQDPTMEPLEARPAKDLSHPVRTTDPTMDNYVDLAGPPAAIFALLDPAGRLAVRKAVVTGWRCANGTWSLELRRRIVQTEELREILEVGFDAVRAMRLQGPLDEALADRVTSDDRLSVRQEALAALVGLGDLSAGIEARLLACDAAIALPIAKSLPSPRDVEALRRMVEHEDASASRGAIEALMKREATSELVRRGLIRALYGDHTEWALETLGGVGEVGDVMAIRAFAEQIPGYEDLADHAVRSIQSHVHGAARGQLALAETAGGEVSVAESEAEARARALRARRGAHE